MRLVRTLADLLLERVVPRAAVDACACNDCFQSDCCSCAGCPMGTAPKYCSNCDCSGLKVVGCYIRQRCL